MADHELPTYEAVVRHVVDYTSGFTASAQAEKLLLQAHVDSVQINGVSEIKAQGNQNQIDFSFLKKEENEKLLLEVSRLISGEQGQAIMKTVASKINKDISTIKMMFFDLSNRLKEIDDSGKSSTKFAARFSDYQMGFYDAIDRTRTNASAIADYAEIFDDLILPIFEDKTITVDEKKALITDYMN
ncbi:hypothetical protein GGR55DRAFT_269341 [Xylaria sp. FL0064]|nr:hypothetical protein GGR55DRAFT_269341 [Xylaria sp. FL0064]